MAYPSREKRRRADADLRQRARVVSGMGLRTQGASAGDVVNIPAGVKHWHGAAKDSWFQHLAMEVPGEETRTEWCEAVDGEAYGRLG